MKVILNISILFILLANARPAAAQKALWNADGVSMGNSPNSEYMNYSFSTTPNFKNMNITEDGVGGTIMCWMTNVAGAYILYAQRVDGSGNQLWTTQAAGVQVATSTAGDLFSNQYFPSCVGDGTGGAYISWQGYDFVNLTYHPFIQHISASGARLWGTNGVVLGQTSDKGTTTYPYIPQLDKDGTGGVWATWYSCPGSATNTAYGTIYYAHLTGGGATPLYYYGVVLKLQSLSSIEYLSMGCNPVICTDNNGDAFIAYQTLLSNTYRNHIAKISTLTGAIKYNTIASRSLYPSYGYFGYNIAPDEYGGATLHYLQYYDSSSYYYMMMGVRVNSAGAIAWGPKLTHQASEFYQYPGGKIAPDDKGGAYFLRYDNWNYYTPALQHIDSSGKLLWNPTDYPSGIGVATNVYNYIQNAQLISDPLGNAITVYANGNKMHLQKWDKTTGLPFAGWPVSQVEFGSGTNPQLVSDGVGGAFVGWNKTSTGYDVYAQHVVDTVMAPQVVLTSANAIAVGSVRVGSSRTISGITLRHHRGSKPAVQLPLSILSLSSRYGLCSIANPTLPTTVSVGDSITLAINITAKKNGLFLDTVLIITNDPINPQTRIAITGTGIYPHLTANDSILMPPTRATETTGNQRTYIFTNTGTDTLHVLSARIASGDASSFSIIGNTAQTVASGGEGMITVGFAPGSAALKSSTVQLLSDDSISPKIILVSGEGIYPHLFADTSLQFPASVRAVRATQRGLLITNTGTQQLIIASSSITGANANEYALLSQLPDTINVGASAQLNIQFAPATGLGTRTATLNLVSNYDSTLQLFNTQAFQVSLSGTSADTAPDPQFAQQINCGNVHVGLKDTVIYRIINSNKASQKLIIANDSIVGLNSGYYSILHPPTYPYTIAIGDSLDLQIVFVAANVGSHISSLQLTSNASTAPMNIPIVGAGIKGKLSIDPLDCGMVGTDTCLDTVLHVSNTGTDVLAITSFSILGTLAPLFTNTTFTTIRLAPSQAADIAVRFCPTAKQRDSAYVRLITGDGDTSIITITGSGVNSGALAAATNIDFGLVAISQSTTKQLWITNTGDIPVTIISTQITNATLPVAFSTDLQTPVVVPPGDSIAANILFLTNTGGPESADIVFRTATSGLTVALSGSATPDPYVLDPVQLFDTSITLGTALVQGVHIYNFRNVPLGVTSIELSGPGANAYSQFYPLAWPFTVNWMYSDSIMLMFRPLLAGTYLATMTVVVNSSADTPPVNDTIRISLTGRATVVGVGESGEVPSQLTLLPTYPNPFTTSTNIGFTLSSPTHITLRVTNILGETIETILNESRGAGTYVVPWNGAGMPPGIYFCELIAGGEKLVRRVVKF